MGEPLSFHPVPGPFLLFPRLSLSLSRRFSLFSRPLGGYAIICVLVVRGGAEEVFLSVYDYPYHE